MGKGISGEGRSLRKAEIREDMGMGSSGPGVTCPATGSPILKPK
jgi:hypothetical protein